MFGTYSYDALQPEEIYYYPGVGYCASTLPESFINDLVSSTKTGEQQSFNCSRELHTIFQIIYLFSVSTVSFLSCTRYTNRYHGVFFHVILGIISKNYNICAGCFYVLSVFPIFGSWMVVSRCFLHFFTCSNFLRSILINMNIIKCAVAGKLSFLSSSCLKTIYYLQMALITMLWFIGDLSFFTNGW